jgi:hypothetical protein
VHAFEEAPEIGGHDVRPVRLLESLSSHDPTLA